MSARPLSTQAPPPQARPELVAGGDDDDEAPGPMPPDDATIAQRLPWRSARDRHPHALAANDANHSPVIEGVGDGAEVDIVQAARDMTEPTTEPKRHSDIATMPESEQARWYEAEKTELANHASNGTFRAKVPVTHLPPGTRVTNTTWAYKDKIGPTGVPIKAKGRLSAQDIKGLRRHPCEHFVTSFSSALPLAAFRVLLALTAYTGNMLFQLDFTGAYLQKKVPADKKIYVRAAPGYPEYVVDKWGRRVEAVYELGAYIYGLQEAGAEWQQELSLWFTESGGFTRSWVEPNMYYRDG